MKLVEPPRHTSFYESFSDLIFGTLCIFMVIVLALTMKLEQAVDEVVSPSRFRGGADYTSMYTVPVKIDGEWHIMWIPIAHYENCGITNKNTDLLRNMFREMANEQFLTIAVKDLRAFATGFRGEFRSFTLNGIFRFAQEYALRNDKHPEWIKQQIELRNPGVVVLLPPPQYVDEFLARSPLGRDRELAMMIKDFNEYLSIWDTQQGTLYARFTETKNETPSIQFTTFETDGAKHVRVGEYTMPVSQFMSFLKSIKAGRGFYIEYVNTKGNPSRPPDWVHEQILDGTGFNGRVISDYAKERTASTGT